MATGDDDDDPFGFADSDRTQLVRPAPGGRPHDRARRATAPREVPRAPPVPGGPALKGTPGRGPLVECAFGILSAAPLLRAHTPPAPVEQLRAQIEQELRAFADRCQERGVDGRLVRLGHYALCALADDVVLNTPWGAQGAWRSHSLAGTLHHDVAAGERFFDHLGQAMRQPERTRPLLELMAACLALGFEGRYRLEQHGQATLQRIRDEVLAALRRLDGEDDGALSARWRGAQAAHRPVAQRVPLWVWATGALALLAVVYAGLAMRLGGITGRMEPLVAGLPPVGPVAIVRPAAAVAAPAPPPVLAPRLRACLPEPARSEAEAVVEDLQRVRVRLPNAALFASGSAELRASVEPVVLCLAEVLGRAGGRVAVLGHTDSTPIRTARFPSNRELSRARAEAVARVARRALDGAGLDVDGRAEAEPVAPNDTEEGRSRNRRVELVLAK